MELTPLLVDVESGLATYGLPALMGIAESVGAIAIHVDDEHSLMLLCAHPRTGEWAYWPAHVVLNPESTGDEDRKVVSLRPNPRGTPGRTDTE